MGYSTSPATYNSISFIFLSFVRDIRYTENRRKWRRKCSPSGSCCHYPSPTTFVRPALVFSGSAARANPRPLLLPFWPGGGGGCSSAPNPPFSLCVQAKRLPGGLDGSPRRPLSCAPSHTGTLQCGPMFILFGTHFAGTVRCHLLLAGQTQLGYSYTVLSKRVALLMRCRGAPASEASLSSRLPTASPATSPSGTVAV